MTEITHWTEEEARRRFQRYPEYRDPDIEWLPEIPAHWDSTRLRFVVETRLSKKEVSTFNPETEVSFVPMEAIREYGGLSLDSTKPLSEVLDGYTYFRDGDVIVAKITPCFENGKGALAKGLSSSVGFGTTELHVLRPSSEVEARFLLYLTFGNHFRLIGEASMYGAGGQKRISGNFVRNFRHPLPSFSEQQAIADFLDRETAKIDALVAKKERLIELLQEKRTALITRAVTRGLDPNVPMKDSGVEWLGEVPAHWQVKKIKRLCLVRRGASPRPIDDPAYFADDGEYAWVRISDVTASARYLKTTTQRLSTLGQSKSVALEPGELFLSIAATVGKPIITTIRCCIHDGFVYFVGLQENREFLFYLFSCGEAYKGLGKLGTQLNLNTDTIGDIFVPVPKPDEQQAIVQSLNFETKVLDALIAEVRKAVSLLCEFRTALISAAVTGKIDVREATPR